MLTFLRSPRDHVYSQYLECKYDHWGIEQTNGTNFPRDYDDVSGAKIWIDYFQNWKITDGDFNCYNPINMETRVLTCNNNQVDLRHEINIYDDENSKKREELAIQHLESVDWVGLTELYHESWCVLMYQLNHTMPIKCGDCTDRDDLHVHDVHFVRKITNDIINNLKYIIYYIYY
jgi:hypothetical protein